MRLSFWTSCLLTVASLLVDTAAADPNRWCAIDSVGGGTNCGFVTIEQCRASVSGVGGVLRAKADRSEQPVSSSKGGST